MFSKYSVLYRYAAVFALSAFLCSALFYIGFMIIQASRCYKDKNLFTTECVSDWIRDYEHGAFYYNLEPEAVENLKKADVITLGNSYIQRAFASQEADDFFSQRGIHYFQLGFGFRESMDFPLSILKRYKVRPRVLIINTESFFVHEPRGPAHEILKSFFWQRINYTVKKLALDASRLACEAIESSDASNTMKSFICQNRVSAGRSRTTGRWFMDFDHPLAPLPILPDPTPYTRQQLSDATAIAREFLQNMQIDPSCVVLTMLPAPDKDADPAFAVALGRNLGTQVINVSLEKMTSDDTRHMDPDTARRWDKVFLPKLHPILSHCLPHGVP